MGNSDKGNHLVLIEINKKSAEKNDGNPKQNHRTGNREGKPG